ncbi:MAG: metallophosphoesterase [Alphaproteobacteria bacterium]|nr:metallophosphoesterase [Alphaproteobacteria bacterium]
MLSWVHFGDLHMTRAEEQNHADLLALVGDANRHLAGGIDFAVLPGDNADNGTAEQYQIVREAVRPLTMPLHILPGDHDFESGSLQAFHEVLEAAPLPKATVVNGHRCLFLDVVSAGGGGPDFRLDDAQLRWLEGQLKAADEAAQTSIVFMHTYPADLRQGRCALLQLLARYGVACVDTGHTHYNELANDGRTIYAATRSTGQIEEGPVGFSVAAVDDGVVSWRFKALAQPWPLVLITSPADVRLVTRPQRCDQLLRPGKPFKVRARAWSSAGISHAQYRIADASWQPLFPVPGDAVLWQGTAVAPTSAFRLTVQVEAKDGGVGEEEINVAVAGEFTAPERQADGSDKDAIAAWPSKGLLGTQLGPNKNGRKW